MKLLQQDGKKLEIVRLHKCISPHCENSTSSFYCDACWDRFTVPELPAS